MATKPTSTAELLEFPLTQAIFGRRARRFGLGMELPSGPLAFRSAADPLPLTEHEQMILVAAATGVSGWSFGVPFGPRTPESHAEFTLRFTGRTAPTAAGLGTPALFFTDDQGCYCTRTRDVQPEHMREVGGLYFNGADSLSVLGANARDGIAGLGFRFVEDERWVTPNPVGLDGVYEALCPPYYPDMHAAVEAFVARKFGAGGAYDPDAAGPWRDSARVKRSVAPYRTDFVDCLSEVARYIHARYGKFPGIRSTIVLPGYVQAHHLDTGFYDAHYREGAYLRTHAEHMERWHGHGNE